MLKTNRKPTYPIHPLIINRWSARAFSQESLEEQELMSLFEAARWAQNSYNNQPWRFLYAWRNSKGWKQFVNLLDSGNKVWAQHASVLVLVVSKKTFDYDGRPSRTHSFDTGAAAQNMALQGTAMDIIVHGMEGFNYSKAQKQFKIPADYNVEALFAIGKLGNKKDLPQALQKREKPSDRKAINEFVKDLSHDGKQ